MLLIMIAPWHFKTFNELTVNELYDILQLRQQVFQLEQNSLFLDIDDIDRKAEHLIHYRGNELIAYLRIFEEHQMIVMGRIVVAKSARGNGLGKALIQKALAYIDKKYPEQPIKVSAQLYLKKFYEDFDFIAIGEPYDEDCIPHIIMKRQIKS